MHALSTNTNERDRTPPKELSPGAKTLLVSPKDEDLELEKVPSEPHSGLGNTWHRNMSSGGSLGTGWTKYGTVDASGGLGSGLAWYRGMDPGGDLGSGLAWYMGMDAGIGPDMELGSGTG